MAIRLTNRQRKIIQQTLDVLGRDSSVGGDMLAHIGALQGMMRATGAESLADLLAGAMSLEGPNAEPEIHRLRQEKRDLEQALNTANVERRLLRRQIDGLTAKLGFGLANAARTTDADRRAQHVRSVIDQITREHGRISNESIARELTRRRVKTPRGGTTWTRMQVFRVLSRTS